MKNAICILIFCGLACFKLQAQTDYGKQLESAVNYLLNNKEELAKVWLSLVKDNSANAFDYKKIIGQKLDFEISDTLSPRGLQPFTDSLRKDKIVLALSEAGIDSLITIDRSSSFAPYSHLQLKHLLQAMAVERNKDFKIVFSQPVINTLRAELWYTYFGRGIRTRFGDSVMILFVFDDKAKIKKVYFKRAIK
jgi:hypothetical protein